MSPSVSIGEIAIVAVGARWNSRRHGRVEFGRVEVPLLLRVVLEELLVQFLTDRVHDDVFGRRHGFPFLADLLEEGAHLVCTQVKPVELVYRVKVDRYRHEHPVHRSQDPVLVLAPLCKTA